MEMEMSFFKPEWNTYQDVRTNLTWWSMPIWLGMFTALYLGVLPPEYRASFKTFVPGIKEWLDKTGSLAVGVILSGVLAQFLIHFVEIHDKVYDRYIVRWRFDYDTRFILPKLLEPYSDRIDLRTLFIAQKHPDTAMEILFYDFAGDRDTKIRKNLLVRFYEIITKYWFTQLVEIAALITGTVTVTVSVSELAFGRPFRESIYWIMISSILVLVLAKLLSRHLRSVVTRRTEDEIADIHRSCGRQFEAALQRFCREHGLRFKAPYD